MVNLTMFSKVGKFYSVEWENTYEWQIWKCM
jgi:hypothetical protein